jgi:tRNA threonylcarbamoyladenosine biosynthesis protein TsaE
VLVDSFRVMSDGPAQTGKLASVLARHVAAGDIILLKGSLASGKTTFVQALAKALGSPDPVTSPTFSLAHFYSAGPVNVSVDGPADGPVSSQVSSGASLLHIDAYRLSGLHEYRDLALDEYLETSVTVIEWGDKIAEDFPCHLMIGFEAESRGPSRLDTRVLTFSSSCPRWLPVLARLEGETRNLTSVSAAS